MKTFLAGPAAGLLALAVTGAADDPAPDDGTGAAFTTCMRDHGVEDFPAATVTDDGRVVLDLDGTGIDPWADAYRVALDACEAELPDGTRLPDDPTPPAPEAPGAPEAPAAPGDPAGPDAVDDPAPQLGDLRPTAPPAPPSPPAPDEPPGPGTPETPAAD